jgi:hypothetical protein
MLYRHGILEPHKVLQQRYEMKMQDEEESEKTLLL